MLQAILAILLAFNPSTDRKESDLSRHLENGNATPTDEAGEREPADDEAASLAETDYELNEALNLLKGLDILRVKG